MAKTFTRFYAILLAALVLTNACSGSSGNPGAPGGVQPLPNPPSPNPGPNPNLNIKRYLVGSDGKPTTMWVIFKDISPVPGNPPTGESMCGGSCYVFKLKAEIGKDEEPNQRSNIVFTLSEDCLGGEEYIPTGSGIVNPGTSREVSGEMFQRMDLFKPKCLVAEGSMPWQGSVLTATFPLELNYWK